MACLSAGARALGSLAETTMAFTCCVVRVLIQVTWSDALAVDGPTCLNDPLRALEASVPPLAAVSKYGLLMALGRKTMLRLLPLLLGVPVPVVVLVLPPQAVKSSITNTIRPDPSVGNSFFIVSLSFTPSLSFPRPDACGISPFEYVERRSVPGLRRSGASQRRCFAHRR